MGSLGRNLVSGRGILCALPLHKSKLQLSTQFSHALFACNSRTVLRFPLMAVSTSAKRIEMLDFARGTALLAMVVFHFAFDLEMFGIAEPGFTQQPQWKYFARAIASAFLFLAGFSLFLAHGRVIRWQGWTRRFVKIAGAALLITIATWFATPDVFIFFGILHAIAAASLVGLLFLRLHWALMLLIAVGVFVLRYTARTEWLDDPWWWWTGLSQITPVSSDYVPMFPWFAPFLAGMALANLAVRSNTLEQLGKPELGSRAATAVKFIGRHSLIFYLLHQPIMIGVLFLVLKGTGSI